MAQNPSGTGSKASGGGKGTDPVCGMQIDPNTAAGSSEYKGQRYFFCSTGCKTNFDSNPAKYVGASQAGGGGRG